MLVCPPRVHYSVVVVVVVALLLVAQVANLVRIATATPVRVTVVVLPRTEVVAIMGIFFPSPIQPTFDRMSRTTTNTGSNGGIGTDDSLLLPNEEEFVE